MAPADGPAIRLASRADALGISSLYQEVYQGTYPDLLMRDLNLMRGFLAADGNLWVLAEHKGRIAASVVYEADRDLRLGKVFGGVVSEEHRGSGLLERCMTFGEEHLTRRTGAVDIIYATTRTTTAAPQRIAEKLGYKQLGVFPNVRKTEAYETHCLSALFCGDALKSRFAGFKLHPRLAPLFDLVRGECGLGALERAAPAGLKKGRGPRAAPPPLELIEAPKFVMHRFKRLIETGELLVHFYPFHEPNILISSPCQRVELFLFLSELDKYCTIIGVKKPGDLDLTQVLLRASKLLRDINVRYIELLARADKLGVLGDILDAAFVPCAYFPAFQLHEGRRYDYVVFSRTFEMLDFSGLKLEGLNREYLTEYYRSWKETSLSPGLSEEPTPA